MEFIQPFITSVTKILILTSAGFILFRSRFAQEKVRKPVLWMAINILLPMYFIHSFSGAWKAALDTGGTGNIPGWALMLSFFIISLCMIALQAGIGWLLTYKTNLIKTDRPFEMVMLFAVSNTGFIPFPILAPVVPKSFMVYMFFYILAFNLTIWSGLMPYLRRKAGTKGKTYKLNMPSAGIVAGAIIAALDLYKHVPAPVQAVMHVSSNMALDVILFVLGSILAGISLKNIRPLSEFKWHLGIKMVLFPAVVFSIAIFLPLSIFDSEIASAMRLAWALEAVAPPATSLMLICAAVGSKEQIDFMGSGILYTYMFSVITIPTFLILCAWLFY
ncbi:hypothetical protein BVX97_01235 [bacterium E08(2017)]|nr:hypothetical protein BVX97_01235 [bacterium E08(2017)]